MNIASISIKKAMGMVIGYGISYYVLIFIIRSEINIPKLWNNYLTTAVKLLIDLP